jgi:hypothetical protein
MLPIEKQEEDALSFGLRCYYCEILLDPNTQNLRNSKTQDHIIPRSKGGNNSRYNKIHCCSDCNHLKSDKELHQFKIKVAILAASDSRYSLMLMNISKLQTYRRRTKKFMLKRKYNAGIIKNNNTQCRS